MDDAERDAEERPDATPGGRSDDKLDDLEPAEDEGAGVKGGGPRNQTASTGGKPTD